MLLRFNFFACSDDFNENATDLEQANLAKFDESNYSFNTINLWGSEAAVIDAGDYYIFQGDIHIKKEDVDKSITKGAGVLNRRWPNNIVYYTISGSPNNTQALYNALYYIESRSYITFVPRRSSDKNYIKFNYINSSTWTANSDYIGMKRGEQNILLYNIPHNLYRMLSQNKCLIL